MLRRLEWLGAVLWVGNKWSLEIKKGAPIRVWTFNKEYYDVELEDAAPILAGLEMAVLDVETFDRMWDEAKKEPWVDD